MERIIATMSLDVIQPREDFLAVSAVRHALRKMWQHALVTDETKGKRAMAKQITEKTLPQIGVPLSDFFAIPVGSVFWTSRNNDFDIFVVAKKDFQVGALQNSVEELHRKSNLHVVGSANEEPLFEESFDLFDLFLVPDEYIAGNVEMARDLRVKLIDYYAENRSIPEFWDNPNSRMNKWFNFRYKNWMNLGQSSLLNSALGFITGKNGKSRKGRFFKDLEHSAAKYHDPGKFKQKFIQDLNTFKLPPFDIYRRAICAAQGKLSIGHSTFNVQAS